MCCIFTKYVNKSRVYVCVSTCMHVCAWSCLTLWDCMDYSLPGSSVHWFLQAWLLKWVTISPPSGDLPYSGFKPMSPALAGRLFTTEPPGKHIYIYVYIYIHICIFCMRDKEESKTILLTIVNLFKVGRLLYWRNHWVFIFVLLKFYSVH